MSKYLKSFIAACLVVCMTVCLGIFAAACTDKPSDDTNGDDNTFPSHLNVTVMLDETTPAVGVEVQPCTVKDNGKTGLCLAGVKTNAQGVASIELDEKHGNVYEIHVTPKTIPSGYAYVDDEGNPYEEGAGMRVDVTKNSSPTITLEEAPTTVGNSDDPLVLALDTTANFKVKLIETEDRHAAQGEDGKLPTILIWNRDSYYATLTTTTAGTYKITLTTNLANEEINEPTVYTPDDTIDADVYSYPTSSTSNENAYSFNYDLSADKTYTVSLSGLNDYKTLANGTKSITYSIKVEYVEDGGNTNPSNIALSMGLNNIPALVWGSPATCTFNGTANTTYSITVSLNEGEWSVDNQTLMEQSTTVTADGNGLVSFVLGYEGFDDDSGNFTLTLEIAE